MATAVCLQLAACVPNFLIQEHFDAFNEPWTPDLVTWRPRSMPPPATCRCPTEPGLGLDVVDEVAAAHPYDENAYLNVWAEGWERRLGRKERRMRAEPVDLEQEAFRAAAGLLDDRVVILTGATGGIGTTIARMLVARARASRVTDLADERVAALAASSRLLRRGGRRCRRSSRSAPSTREAEATLGPTDGIVNCAGLWAPLPLRRRRRGSVGATHRRQPRHRVRHLPHRPAAGWSSAAAARS